MRPTSPLVAHLLPRTPLYPRKDTLARIDLYSRDGLASPCCGDLGHGRCLGAHGHGLSDQERLHTEKVVWPWIHTQRFHWGHRVSHQAEAADPIQGPTASSRRSSAPGADAVLKERHTTLQAAPHITHRWSPRVSRWAGGVNSRREASGSEQCKGRPC